MTLKNLFSVLFLGLIISGCSSDPLDVDVSNVKLDIKFHNVRSDLYKAKSKQLVVKNKLYAKEIPDLYSYYLGKCIGFPENMTDSVFVAGMESFQKDTVMQKFEKAIDGKFSNLKSIEEKLLDGFKHLKYHLPNGKMPEDIAFMNLTLKSSIFCTEKEIGIGLERYLGPKHTLVKKLDSRFWFKWIKDGMDRKFLERDVLAGWIETHIIKESEGTLAERIVGAGKVLYLVKASFPDMDDDLVMRYSKSGWNWAVKNEESFWNYLIAQQMLFGTDVMNVMNMINPGPTTSGLPEKGGPDRMGQFLGYQMVKKYMENNEVKLSKLPSLSYNEILQAYKD